MRPNIPVEYPHPPEVLEVLRASSKGYGWPSFGHDAEMKSLVYHVKLREGVRKDPPVDYQRRDILSLLEEQYRLATWEIPADFLSYDHFCRAVHGLDFTSSPGYPYMMRATSNGDFFQRKGDQIPEYRLKEIWELVKMRMDNRDADPIRLFIKPEPHKESKLQNKRFRLISSVSVVDQLIDVMLFGEFNRLVNDNCVRLPCKGGWSPLCGGWKIVPPQGTMSLDKSGWDWSAQGWLFEMELQLRTRLCSNLNARWLELATWRYRKLFWDPVFITSGGMLLRQRNPGVMKSGCYNTLVSNSIMQSLIHLRACQELDMDPGWIWTLGDDTLQSAIPALERGRYLEAVSQYCHVKHCVDGAEFAGMRFRGPRVEPLYRGKHAFQLLHMQKANASEMADSYKLLYHRSNKKPQIDYMLKEFGRTTDEERSITWDLW